ncbi:MAG: hypothetical protein ABEK59_03105 [Halobacteria archaeon]
MRRRIREIKETGIERDDLAVFAAGIISMGMEIIAGRLTAPYFGSTVYTWGTVIGVFLSATT